MLKVSMIYLYSKILSFYFFDSSFEASRSFRKPLTVSSILDIPYEYVFVSASTFFGASSFLTTFLAVAT